MKALQAKREASRIVGLLIAQYLDAGQPVNDCMHAPLEGHRRPAGSAQADGCKDCNIIVAELRRMEARHR